MFANFLGVKFGPFFIFLGFDFLLFQTMFSTVILILLFVENLFSEVAHSVLAFFSLQTVNFQL